MILYVDGDSHSYGWEAGGPQHSYGAHLAKKLSAEFVCGAYPGSSNDSIIRRTKNYLTNNTPNLIVIGWTTWEREEWSFEGQYFNVNSSGHDPLPAELQKNYKEWVVNVSKNWIQKEVYWHNQIYKFHTELLLQKIPHLFFNCYLSFKHVLKHYPHTIIDWDRNYLNPYEEEKSYFNWCVQQGFIPINPQQFHHGPEAHAVWAEYLNCHLTKLL